MPNKNKIPLQARGINTRNNIILIAFKSFLKNGYKKTSTTKIAKEAGVSVGIIYSYFNDKDELLELWLNNLLEKCEDYFYDQFKLRDYNVELYLIINNILEKLTSRFFCSPIVSETLNRKAKLMIDEFYSKAEKIFIKACYNANLVFKHQNEISHIILGLIKNYSLDLKSDKFKSNNEVLKKQYIKCITSLLD